MKEIITFAATNFRNTQQVFGIKTDDRRRHMYFIGKTGMGKSTVLENMIIQDIQAGHGVCVIDPHGDLVEKIIDFIPPERINDVVYFNPSDLDYPIGFNVLESVDEDQRHLVVSGLIGVFKKIWADSWGPRLEYVLHHAISALLEYPGSTLLGIMRMLVDKSFRKRVINKVTDPVVKSFWVDEYSKYPDRFQAEAIAPIQNKVGRFLSSALIRNILGQVKSSFEMREIMDKQKILLMNLAKGRVGEDNSALLGAMMITKIQLAAMSRVNIPETERRDFYLYVDEFQNFATESFANILSEARKYRLNLIIAHQYIEQVDEKVAAAVFGNVGTIVSFRVGATDAEFLEKEFFPVFTQEDLVNLAKYEVYMKLMIDGVASEAFSALTLPPIKMPEHNIDVRSKVVSVSRERYAKPREIIEDKITRWSETRDEGEEDEGTLRKKNFTFAPDRDEQPKAHQQSAHSTPNKFNKARSRFPEAKKNHPIKKSQPVNEPLEVLCSFCGGPTIISFEPDPNKPIYCQNCLKLAKEGKIPPPSSIKKIRQEALDNPLSNSALLEDNEGYLSLADALKMKPQKINSKGEEKNQPPRPSLKDQPKEIKPDENSEDKIITPGQTIKFD